MSKQKITDSLSTVLSGFLETTNTQPFLFLQTRHPQALRDMVLTTASSFGKTLTERLLERMNHEAYGPFLGWVREQCQEWSEEQLDLLLEKAGVYIHHRALFKQYFSGDLVWRNEDLIPKEFDFELSCIHKGLTGLLDAFTDSDAPRVFLVTNAQNMSASGVSFLLDIWRASATVPVPFKCLFIVSIESVSPEQDAFSPWRELLDHAQEQRSFINLVSEESGPAEGAGFRHCGGGIELAVETYFFLAHEDCRIMLECIHKENEEGRRKLSEPELYLLWKTLGQIYFQRREFDLATSAYQTALALARKNNQGDKIADLYYRIGLVHFEKRNLDYARVMAAQCWKLSESLGNEPVMFYAKFLDFLIQDKVRLQSFDEFRAFYTDIIRRAKKLGFYNTLAYIYTNPFGLFSEDSPEAKSYQDRGLRIAKQHRNTYRLAYAYQTAALVASVKGNYKDTLEYYEKSRRIKVKLRDPLELCYINNGLGFYNYMTGRYQQAHRYYRMALDYLREAKDFDEVGMTLFNMSVNAMLSANYRLAATLIEICQDLLHTMNNRQLAYHSELGILMVQGVSLFLSGDTTRAWQINLRVEMDRLQPFPKKNEEFFLLHIFRALLSGDTKFFDVAEHYLYEPNDNIEYFAPFFFMIKGDVIAEQANTRDGEAVWRLGLEDAKKRENPWYTQVLASRLSAGTQDLPVCNLKGIDRNWGWIMTSAKMQKHLVSLHQRIEEIQFLNTFQTVTAASLSRETLMKESMDLLYNSFEAVGVYAVRWRKHIPSVEYERGHPRDTDNSFLHILLPLTREDRARRFYADVPGENESLADVFRHLSLYSIFLDPAGTEQIQLLFLFDKRDGLVRTETMQVLSIAGRQYELAMSRLEQGEIIRRQNDELSRKNLLLEKTSSTDQLTGIGNRSALETALRLELSRMKRSRRPADIFLSVLFVDLDNFKYFNDRFGHTVGDRLLVETAALFERASRDTDLVFRYGGDEFVLLLPETPLDGAQGVATRLIQSLAEAKSFRAAIQEITGLTVEIPENCQLGCSVGITGRSGVSKDIDTPESLLDRSDRALYEAKKAGKARFFIFQS